MGWSVRVGDTVYGPYRPDQVRHYVAEGRITATSLMAPQGTEDWRQAARHPDLAPLFGHEVDLRLAPAVETEEEAAPSASARAQPQEANFLIFLEDRWRPDDQLDRAIHGLGRASRIHAHLWALRSRFRAKGIRSHIAQYLDQKDRMLVIDTTRDQSASFNMGLDTETRLRAIWTHD